MYKNYMTVIGQMMWNWVRKFSNFHPVSQRTTTEENFDQRKTSLKINQGGLKTSFTVLWVRRKSSIDLVLQCSCSVGFFQYLIHMLSKLRTLFSRAAMSWNRLRLFFFFFFLNFTCIMMCQCLLDLEHIGRVSGPGSDRFLRIRVNYFST